MKIICCNCKKEYSMEENIFKYDETNCPILICPYCGFKHIINFMPFEKEIKTERIKKLNLGAYYPVTIGASRFVTANRVSVSLSDDADIGEESGTAWVLADLNIRANKLVSGQDTAPYKVVFKPNGLKMYLLGYATRDVYQYILSIPWVVTSAVYNNIHKDLSTEDIAPNGIFFKPDGKKMYMCGGDNDKIFQYSLSTAWDLSTLSYDTGEDFTLPAAGEKPNDLYFKKDGTKMYVVSSWVDKVSQYNLTTAWDLSTASYNCEILISGQATTPHGISFKSDGTKMYILNYGTHYIYQYGLSTAWLVSSATYDSIYKDVLDEEEYPRGLWFKEEGTKLYVVGSAADTIHQYVLPGPWDRTEDFILAIRIWGSKGPHVQAFKLRWRKVGGTFADVGAAGAITYNATTDLIDDNDLLFSEKKCDVQSGYGWQNGKENEGDNILPNVGTYSLADEYYTELQWALSCDDAEGGAEYEFELWDTTEGASLGTCLATIKMSRNKNASGKASINSNIVAIVQVTTGGPTNRTGKASLTSSVIAVLSRGKIENATAKASITSSVIALLEKEPKNATAKASLTTTLTAVLSRGKIENATAKSDLTTNMDAILSRGKIENAIGKADITTLMQAILSNYINATAKASIDSNIDITLARGKIENATGLASIISSVISILSRGKIEAVTGKSSITSNFESILSRGKIENVTGKADIASSIITVLSRGKIENVTGKAGIETSVIIILSRGGIKNATGKAEITTNIDSQIRIIRKATAKSSITSLIDIILLRGKIENTTGKASINSSIIIALSRGKIESVTGKADITSGITAVLSRGQIESVTGKAEINTIMDIILNRGAIENASGIASIISNLTAILQKEAAINATGKASITTNIEAGINRIIARAGKASLETSYNTILSRGGIVNVNGKAFIYTSINTALSRTKRATGKASINSFINISLKNIINASGKSMFDTLVEIEITQEFAFTQATLGIAKNESGLSIKETRSILGIQDMIMESDIKE